MLNYIWAAMMLTGIVYAVITGNVAAVTEAVLESAGEAVSLCISMAGIMAFWMGLMEIAEEAGLVRKMTKGLKPLLQYLFPGILPEHKAMEYIAANMIANILGLGWACTPAGLKAMGALAEIEKEKGNLHRASNAMCTFLILNISSLQLIPVNMIAYRSRYGSQHPASIVAPAIAATCVSTFAGIVFCKIMEKKPYQME